MREDFDKAAFLQAEARLASKGVLVSRCGEISFDEVAFALYNSGPWCADTPVKELLEFSPRTACGHAGQGSKLHSRIMRALHALSATKVFHDLHCNFEREVMLSAGGRMVGKIWTECPRGRANFIDNDHLRKMIQLRLALVSVPAGSVCHIMKVGDEEKCLTSITAPCVHPHVCKAGPARLRHRAVMTTCKHALRKAGAEIDLERALPYLYVVSMAQ